MISELYLTKISGDPFLDVGGFVIKRLKEKPFLKDKSILELIDYVSKIYVNNWNSKLNAYFLNSKITQPSFKPDRKLAETKKYYESLIEETTGYTEGHCRMLGFKTKLFPAGRDNHILSGSGTFINFHHNFQYGLMLSKEALIRMFFVPFGTLQLSDKIAVINSNNLDITKKFVYDNVDENIAGIASGSKNSEGVLKSKFNNPATGLFEFVANCLHSEYFKEIRLNENTEINLFHFTNFGAKPEIKIYNFGVPLFSFYKSVLHRTTKQDWSKFIKGNYYNSKNKDSYYDFDLNKRFEKNEKLIDYEDYRTWVNWIYQDLLLGKSLLPNIRNWTKKHSMTFKITRLYQIKIKNMESKALDKIEQISDFIIKDENSIKKTIGKLNRAEKIYEIRRIILQLIDNNHKQKNEQPLVTLADAVNYLFSDSTSVREIRDLILISIYQKMHENDIFFDDKYEESELILESE